MASLRFVDGRCVALGHAKTRVLAGYEASGRVVRQSKESPEEIVGNEGNAPGGGSEGAQLGLDAQQCAFESGTASDGVFLLHICPHCSGRIEFPDHGAGEAILCPHCGQRTVLRRDDTPPE